VTIRDLSITEYLQALARRGVAPTGGAVAALCAAQASALVMMVAQSTNATGSTQSVRMESGSVSSACEGIITELLNLMEQDCKAVEALIPALPSRRGVYEAGTAESSTLVAALADATWSQVGVLKVGTRLLGLAEGLAPLVPFRVRADLVAAVEVVRSALLIALLNVDVNASLLSDQHRTDVVSRTRDDARVAVHRAEELAQHLGGI
jgi:methenyltetrahydrofolate cyclohydrolase